MRWLVIAFILIWRSSALASVPQLSFGGGIEARFDHDVNSDYGQADSMGLVFVTAAWHPWSALWEIDNFQTANSEGNYAVRTSSFGTMLWGRYEPVSYWPVSPYGGVGIGWNFANVTSTFGSASDQRWTDGGAMIGGAIGAMADFWRHWKVEAEIRLVKPEFDVQPVASFVLRTGYTF
jgi:hypothetical protein